jgi:hypothetical protein
VKWTVLAATLFAGLAGAAPASAGTLDQQQTNASDPLPESLGGSVELAQTYTAGISGQQDQVDLSVDRDTSQCGATPAGLIVEIHGVDAVGEPDGPSLSTATVSDGAIPEFISDAPPLNYTPVSFASPATVSAGTRYAIVVRSPDTPNGCYAWYGSNADLYTRGSALRSTDSGGSWSPPTYSDFAFKTYVTPPPPDIDAPETTITKDVKRSETGKAKFRFTSDEAGASFECKLKGPDLKRKLRQFRDCTSPRKYKNLDDGRFKFVVRAIDAAGNVDPTPDKDRFRVVD